jgi:hypothetical protein
MKEEGGKKEKENDKFEIKTFSDIYVPWSQMSEYREAICGLMSVKLISRINQRIYI